MTLDSAGCQIKDYAVIGDCRSAALVSRFGSLDWLCWPRFDSPALFAALLDRERGGRWSLAPAGKFEAQRTYAADSNVLETHFRTASGAATLTDLMPVASEEFKNRHLMPDHEIVRRIACHAGEVWLEMHFEPRAEYGLRPLAMKERGALGLRIEPLTGACWLRCDAPLQVAGGVARARFRLAAGESARFSLSYGEESPMVLPPLGGATDAAIERSRRWWEQWAAQCAYQGPYRAAVVRSALALKLLAYAPSGAIIAAATTSLPERIGAGLNWDYRYCWLRDASHTMRALLGLGYRAEAEGFLGWLVHATRLTHPRLRAFYTVFGRNAPEERALPHLGGFCRSQPVRVGNAARDQLQLDIYGELIDAAAQLAAGDGGFDRTTQKVLLGLGKYVAEHWDEPDEGIWEPRTGRKHHTYSRLMCWVALERLLTLGERAVVRGVPVEAFVAAREKIRAQVERRGWNDQRRSYVSTLDGEALDACLLRLAWYGFEPPDSERMRHTYQAIRQELGAGGALLYRYRSEPAEGAFGMCGFWLVEYLAQGGGTLAEAHAAFQSQLSYANDVGLFAEEIDPSTGAALGNFPQSFTHVGLISAALTLAEREVRERGEAPRVPHRMPQREPAPLEARS